MLTGVGTGVRQLYNSAGPESVPADIGAQFGNQLMQEELVQKMKYTAPTGPRREELRDSAFEPNLSKMVNLDPTQPVKYMVPTPYGEKFKDKAEIRDAINAEPGSANERVVRTDPIGDDEVNYLRAMKAQGELADFDRYVNTMIDPRQPGNLKWLMEIYPQFVQRRLSQVHTDYEFALRNQLIDSWGVNTFDDLHFKYLVDQGKIDGPTLDRPFFHDSQYAAGYLSPWNFMWNALGDDRPQGLRLPFASAKTGQRPANPRDWELTNNGQPLGVGRTTRQLAQGMHNVMAGGGRPSSIGGSVLSGPNPF